MSQDFEGLVDEYHRLVMALIRRYYGGRLLGDAEDLSQEIWGKLWESFQKNENNIVNFKSYLYRTVQTTLWDAARELEKRQLLAPLEAGLEPRLESAEVDSHRKMELDRLLADLKSEEARMVRAYIEGFDNGEIAALLGTSEGRVRNLLSRLKKKLASWGERHAP